MAQITGLGGIFFKTRDVERTRRWYADMLGLTGEFGIALPWNRDKGEDPYSLLGPFSASTDYFDPSDAPFMINLRVDDLDGFLRQLEAKGIDVLGRQDEDYGKFAWILD
ncbi:MAG: VOC family protein, partial [Sphingomonadales bacterium]